MSTLLYARNHYYYLPGTRSQHLHLVHVVSCHVEMEVSQAAEADGFQPREWSINFWTNSFKATYPYKTCMRDPATVLVPRVRIASVIIL